MIGLGQGLLHDIILLKDGEEISAKVLEVNEEAIKYKVYSNQDGPIYTKLKEDIFLIKYSNGDKEVFSIKSTSKPKAKKILLSGASTFMYESGQENENFHSSTSIALLASVGGFLTKDVILGVSLAFNSFSSGDQALTSSVIGPFLRGYLNNTYAQVGYSINSDINTSSLGIGHQLYLNEGESVSINPAIIYYNSTYNSWENITQNGILIGCSIEIHL